ncbi:MAG: aspartate aminotransferase family protein [Acidimicrobiales bacterium]
MSTHEELLARHRRALPDWLALYYETPISLVSGEGRHVVDAEGNRYLDFFGGILTTMTAYSLPEVVDAIREQAGKMMHSSTLYLVESMIDLAEKVGAVSGIPDAKVFFATSGSEANEAALLLASTVRRSNQVLALRNSYHGRSFATMGVTGNRGWSSSSLSPFAVSYVHNGDMFRSPFRDRDEKGFVDAIVEDLRHVIATTTAGDVACMIAEPIQGVGGFTVPPDGLLGELQEVCREFGILWITDEVQTGWGRTGENFWGYQAHGLEPDMLTFAKGLGNGLAMAGVVASAPLMDSVNANSISTFGGNPLVCAGALANLDYLLSNDLQANSLRQGGTLIAALRPLVDDCSIVGDVRGKGLIVGIELVGADGREPNASAASAVLETCRVNGLLIGKGGLYGNCLRVAPPLSLTDAECIEGVTILIDALQSVNNSATS